MGDWEFYRIPGNGADEPSFLWAWQCRREDGSVVSSPETFRFLLDCVAHARLHGYEGGKLMTRREVSQIGAPQTSATHPQDVQISR